MNKFLIIFRFARWKGELYYDNVAAAFKGMQNPYNPDEYRELARSTAECLGVLLIKKGRVPMKKGIKSLEELGFVMERPDPQDREYIVYRKDFKHRLLKGLHVCVENEYITVFCRDRDNKNDAVIVKRKRKLKTLYKILHWVSIA